MRRGIVEITVKVIGKFAVIPLGSGGYYAVIDAEDVAKVLSVSKRWKVRHHPHGDYAATSGKDCGILLHRVVMDVADRSKPLIDHVDGNGLNCTRENLRTCTNQQNLWNKGKQSNGKNSKYKGVTRDWNGTWVARIQGDYLGGFLTEDAAARAYDEEAVKRYGDFAKLNFL